jgi:hypothetical protein
MRTPHSTVARSLLAVLALLALAACGGGPRPVSMAPEQLLTGTLTARSPVMPGSQQPYAEYVYRGSAGERLIVEMRSPDFDTYLYLGRMEGGAWVEIAADDDGGEGTDSRLIVDLDRGGEYRIRASAYSEAQLGRYTLTARSVRPSDAAPRAIQYGQQVTGQLSLTDPIYEGSFHHDYVIEGRRGAIEIELISDDFDAYLHLGRMQGGVFQEIAHDDDGGEGTDSRLVHELPAAGQYVIRATSYREGRTGSYVLRVHRPLAQIGICVLTDGRLEMVRADYNTATGDTLVAGRPFRTVHPTDRQYAAGAVWYMNNQPITVQDRSYVKYGLPRILGANEVTRFATFQGVPVFAEAGARGRPDVLYVPVRPGCEFQPYQVSVGDG